MMFPHVSNWSTLRTILAITITVSLWWGSAAVWSVRVGARGGLGSLAGLVVDEYQLGLLAPHLAAHLGVTVL